MNITFFTFGTRGDVQPCLALSVGLQRAGHCVTLVAPMAYKTWIESHGVIHFPLRFDFMDLFKKQPESVEPSGGLRQRIALLRAFVRRIASGVESTFDDYERAAQGADFIIQTGHGNGGVELAEKLSIPMAFSYLYPFSPTREFVAFFWPFRRSFGRLYNRWTHRICFRVSWRTYGPPLNAFRARLGLPAWKSYLQMLRSRRHLGSPHLLAYSPSLLSKPADWDETHEVTGDWVLDDLKTWLPPDEIENFLARGPAPLFFTFGSMPSEGNPEDRSKLIIEVLRRTGQRGLLLVGGGQALARVAAPDSVAYVDSIPYAWLLPRVSMLINHGAPGTMSAGLRAGVPQIITPVAFDQLGWAERVTQKGLGLSPSRFSGMTVENLTQAVRRILADPEFRERAAAFAEIIVAEDGVTRAVKVIERHAAEFHARQR